MTSMIIPALILAASASSGDVPDEVLAKMQASDVVIAGEIHDNPVHHERQAEISAALQPSAIAYEMLTPGQARRAAAETGLGESRLRTALDWDGRGWPDFAMYFPIVAVAPEARIYGAQVPRDEARKAAISGVASAFGDESVLYGLDIPLPPEQQIKREALQMAAHCNAISGDMLPKMVDVQRLRDAALARAVIRALDDTGGPVLVITGNGHARKDWGIPAVLERVRPGLTVFSLGQTETEHSAEFEARYDHVLVAPPVERKDPCAAFR
ncbi:MAG: ChaN family lipoprotein [Roseovarius sp.]|nr:ChaN family lipoprotein [Roseovarius sp.]